MILDCVLSGIFNFLVAALNIEGDKIALHYGSEEMLAPQDRDQ
ncbi:hypothetical protein RGUI_1075 [Rhodovulum sp. P5]|nr:hypothetical protein RGUI_1075 [Rhodovulum sp. P5]